MIRGRAEVRPTKPPIAEGFILCCLYATGRGTSAPVEWHFPTIEAVRAFCFACDFAWSIVAEPDRR